MRGESFYQSQSRVIVAGVCLCFMFGVTGLLHGALVEDFDTNNPYAMPFIFGSPPGPDVVGGGPNGNFLRLVYDGVHANMNSYAFGLTDEGLYPRIDTVFEFRIGSVSMPADGFAFMLIPTSVYGEYGEGAYRSYGSGEAEKPNFPLVFGIGFDVYPFGTNQVTIHWDGKEVGSADVDPALVYLSGGMFHQAYISLEFVGGGAFVSMRLAPDVYGSPGSKVDVFSDLYVEGVSPFEYRVEFAGRTGGLTADIDIDNIKVVAEAGPLPANCRPLVSDLNKDCWVNFLDLAILARDWLSCSIEPEGDCYE